jgi:hypothetical protein
MEIFYNEGRTSNPNRRALDKHYQPCLAVAITRRRSQDARGSRSALISRSNWLSRLASLTADSLLAHLLLEVAAPDAQIPIPEDIL